MNANHLIKNIVDNDLCIGCGLCAGINPEKIEMKLDDIGFLTPVITDHTNTDLHTEIIENCCPGINTHSDFINEDGFWGKILGCYTGYSTDSHIRYAGSSGGAITALLNHLLKSNQIDGVIQIGPNFDKSPFHNEVYLNTTPEDILKCASSRYSPSSPLMRIDEIMSRDIKVAFVGKPCDITALRNLAKFDKRINEKVLYMFSFFCAGLPSEIGSDNVLKKMDVEKNDVAAFRYRGNGWPGKTTATLNNGKKVKITYNEAWGKILGRSIHHRCKICTDSIGMSADIVAADAWYSKGDGYPNFEEKDGRSLILSRTIKGEELLQKMSNNKLLVINELNQKEIFSMQPGQVNKREQLLGRLLAVGSNPFQMTPRYNFKNIYNLSKNTSKIKNIKAFIGMYKRIIEKVLKIEK